MEPETEASKLDADTDVAGFILEDTDSELSDFENEEITSRSKDEQIAEPVEVDQDVRKSRVSAEENVLSNDNTLKQEDADQKEEVEIDFAIATDQEEDLSREQKATEEDEELQAETSRKRGRRLKKKLEKKIAFDGREVVFVTEFTQTDWKWKDKAESTGKAIVISSIADMESVSPSLRYDSPSKSLRSDSGLKSILVKPESREAISQAQTEGDSTVDDRTGTDLTPFSLQPNDEFGIPLLEMSSDSDSSDDDMPKKSKSNRHHLPTIGPPKILKYIRESDQPSNIMGRSSSELDDSFRHLDSADMDERGFSGGMFSGSCEFCANDIKPFPTLEQQLSLPPETLYCCDEYREFIEFAMNTANRLEEDVAKKSGKIDVKVHAHHGSKQARKMAKEQAVQRMRERELQRRQQEATGMQAAYFQSAVARQMKTINYQLSSQRCLEEGWTLRAPSPLDIDDIGVDVFVPEPLHPAMIASGKVNNRSLIEKFYPDGSKFLTIFPDGTGNVFYPSGNLAILIVSIRLGQYTYIVQDDCEEPEILAVFEPTGFGCCYFSNGNVRLNYDQIGGIELDVNGGRKRNWNWKDQEMHVHAPPFQPIVFGMNRYMGVRFMAQESIALTLTGRKRSCRFNVGAKLKLVAPENIQPKGIDENQLFIHEKKLRVDMLLNKVSMLLKFPKSPKLDSILPPLSVTSRKQKVEKMREDYTNTMQSQTLGRKPKKVVQQSRLSPLPVISVN